MALINCPECGGKLSDTVDACIHCGYKLKKTNIEDKEEDTQEHSKEENTDERQSQEIPPNMKECRYCHKLVGNTATICPSCGANVESTGWHIWYAFKYIVFLILVLWILFG